jgi:hypothetical protein
MHHNSPFPYHLSIDPDFAERFWYWHGASGRRYIHTVYKPRNCPPLSGGVYVAVKRQGELRLPLAVGFFCDFWDLSGPSSRLRHENTADEIHVHLLARNPEAARAVAEDISSTMNVQPLRPPRLFELAEEDSIDETRAA